MFLRRVFLSLLSPRKTLRLLSPWSVAIGAMMIFSLASCSDFGERDNPYDPVAANFNVALWWPTSSSEGDSSETTSTQKFLWTYQRIFNGLYREMAKDCTP